MRHLLCTAIVMTPKSSETFHLDSRLHRVPHHGVAGLCCSGALKSAGSIVGGELLQPERLGLSYATQWTWSTGRMRFRAWSFEAFLICGSSIYKANPVQLTKGASRRQFSLMLLTCRFVCGSCFSGWDLNLCAELHSAPRTRWRSRQLHRPRADEPGSP